MVALEPTQQWLAIILDTIDEGIHAVDTDGVTIVYNRAAGRMDGLAPKDVIGKHVLDVFPSLGQSTSTLLQVLKTGQAIQNQSQTYTNLFGSKVHTVNTTLPIKTGGRIIGALEIAKNLTQVRHLTDQVLALQAQVVSGRRAKSNQASSAGQAVYQFSHILTEDAAMRDTLRRAERCASTTSPILIYGETGTGKELLVQSIHNASPRVSQPFLALNCAALPASLLEGILFGTVRGSFTGAEDRPGLFELADTGTLFLDEIQSMPMELQAKLLRVLQEGEIMRVGDTRIRRLNVRVIAAMNQPPESALTEGQLREDLYYRINVVRLNIPPLRNRGADVTSLTQHFIDKWNARFGASVEGVASDVAEVFSRYHWPGNVRELENAIEAAMNLVTSGYITMDVLPAQLREWSRLNGVGVGRLAAGSLSVSGPVRDEGAFEGSGSADGVPEIELGTPSSPSSGAGNSAHSPPGSEPGLERGQGPGSGPGSGPALLRDQAMPWADALVTEGMNEFWQALESEELPAETSMLAEPPTWRDLQAAFERIILIHALQACHGNVKQAAAKLGIPRQTLQYRIKQLG